MSLFKCPLFGLRSCRSHSIFALLAGLIAAASVKPSLCDSGAEARGFFSGFVFVPKFAQSYARSTARAVTLTPAMRASLRRVRANAASPPLVA